MLKLAAFADEISPDLDLQIKTCLQHGVSHFELRGVDKINVLDFSPQLRQTVRSKIQAAGMAVVCIGSPIGKVKIDEPWHKHFDRFKIAVESALHFSAPLIRIFSYYPPDGQSMDHYRDEVLRRMQQKIDFIQNVDVTLVHENERHIFGDRWRQCLDLMTSINSPKFKSAFDFANFVQVGEKPLDCWPALKPYSIHIHVKDALLADGKVVPAGDGDGQIEPILKDAYASGFRGFLSLEPHLQFAGQSHGETGVELFGVAANALKAICKRLQIPLEHP